MTDGGHEEILAGLLDGRKASLARAISMVEDREDGYRELLKAVFPHSGSARVIGITGSPGSGKSTLVNALVEQFQTDSERIGVVGVDPSSPFTGGSILGDRVRFQPGSDEDVFFRSMSARGVQGGLAAATGEVIRLMDAAGYDPILVETVGAGQSEVDVVRTADTVLVVTMPSTGDDVQMLKAGILEIGDVFVVNKADLTGADRTAMDLEQMVRRSQDQSVSGGRDREWEPPVVKTVATEGDNLEELREAIISHGQYLRSSDRLREKRVDRCGTELSRLIEAALAERVDRHLCDNGGIRTLAEQIYTGESDPYTLAEDILASLEGT